jgi:hypothetical protein
VEKAEPGETVTLAEGTYALDRFLSLRGEKGLTIRGASDDPGRVVLRGRGFDRRDEEDDILRVEEDCEGVTIAFLTFTDCHSYGIKVEGEHLPKDIHVYGCHFRDIGMRSIKGSVSKDGRVARGSIRYCLFENTKVPRADWLFNGNYITAIDLMALEDWTISDNVFRNIKGRTGEARAAIFVWVRSRRVTVERNVIVGCDRGIAFGNPSGATSSKEGDFHVADSLCRNNFIVPGPDAGIELSWVRSSKILNNTIWRTEGKGRGIRCIEQLAEVEVANNLVRGEIAPAPGVTLRNNLAGGLDGFFADAPAGDLHLTGAAGAAVGRGIPLADVPEDFDRQPRRSPPTLGADEPGPAR